MRPIQSCAKTNLIRNGLWFSFFAWLGNQTWRIKTLHYPFVLDINLLAKWFNAHISSVPHGLRSENFAPPFFQAMREALLSLCSVFNDEKAWNAPASESSVLTYEVSRCPSWVVTPVPPPAEIEADLTLWAGFLEYGLSETEESQFFLSPLNYATRTDVGVRGSIQKVMAWIFCFWGWGEWPRFMSTRREIANSHHFCSCQPRLTRATHAIHRLRGNIFSLF